MAGRAEGKVAFITGAGRGQGRSHAIRLAGEGADIIAVDICRNHDTVGYGMSTICTSSTAGIKGLPFLAPYVAAKHGVAGIARTMANELAQHKIRVNTVHPTGVNTPMVEGPGGLNPLIERDPDLGSIFLNSLPIEAVEAQDISNAVLFLASGEAQYVTGLEFTVDAGNTIR